MRNGLVAGEVEVIFYLIFQSLVRVLRQLSNYRSWVIIAFVMIISCRATEVISRVASMFVTPAAFSMLLTIICTLEVGVEAITITYLLFLSLVEELPFLFNILSCRLLLRLLVTSGNYSRIDNGRVRRCNDFEVPYKLKFEGDFLDDVILDLYFVRATAPTSFGSEAAHLHECHSLCQRIRSL